MRYVLGPSSDFAPINPPASAPTGLADLTPTITARDEAGVTLAFAAFDPATAVAPVEVRGYWMPEGSTPPDAAAGWLGSSFPNSHAAVAVPPEGIAGLTLPTPAEAFPPAGSAPVGYFFQSVLGFNV